MVTLHDGAAGLFVRDTANCGTNYDDGGSILQDSQGACFDRQNLNGDLRQWGLTQNSLFDVIAHPTGASDAAPIIIKAFAALGGTGIKTLHTHGVSLKIGSLVWIPSGSALTCDTPPVANADRANYSGLPGMLVISHGSQNSIYIDAYDNADPLGAKTQEDTEIYNCAAIIPEWYINANVLSGFGGQPISHPFASHRELENYRVNMALAADFAIKAGPGTKLHDLSIIGFDNCIFIYKAARFLGKNIKGDCNIGVYANQGGGSTDLSDTYFTPLGTMMPGGNADDEEYWNVTSVAPSPDNTNAAGHPVCRVTIVALNDGNNAPLFSVVDLPNTGDVYFNTDRGDPLWYPSWVTGIGGGTQDTGGYSCNNAGGMAFGNDAAWAIKVISKTVSGTYSSDTATIDLLGSDFGHSNGHIDCSSESSSNGYCVHTTAQWDGGNYPIIHISGPIANIAAGQTAHTTDPNWPSTDPTVVSVIQQCPGSDPDDGYNGCVILSAPPKGPSASTIVAITFDNGALTYNSSNDCQSNASGRCFFVSAAERYYSGNSPAGMAIARLPASRGGHMGAGFLMDGVAGFRTTNTFSYGHYYGPAAMDSNSCAMFENVGDDHGELNPGNLNFMYDAGSSRGCLFNGNKNAQSGNSIVLDTYGTVDTSLLASMVDVHSLGAYGTSTISVASGQPTNSFHILHICKQSSGGACATIASDGTPIANEYVAYRVVDSANVNVYVRGRFGTAPVNWNTACSGGPCSADIYATQINGGSVKHPDRSTTTIFTNLSNPTSTNSGNQFLLLHGSATLSKVNTNGGGTAFVSANTGGVSISQVNESKTSLFFENANAEVLTSIDSSSTFANYAPHPLGTPLIFSNSGPDLPQVMTDSGGGKLATAYGVGKIAVEDVSNWPASGIALIDSEYVAYSNNTGESTKLTIERRGMCGSLPAPHLQYAVVLNAEAVLGCSPSTLPLFALQNDGSISGFQPQLMHGQVYLSLDAVNSRIQLCPYNGPGGLIVAGVLRQVPSNCVVAPLSAANTSALSYVYASWHMPYVSAIGSSGGHVQVTLTDTDSFFSGQPISCTLNVMTTPPSVQTVVNDSNTTYVSSSTVTINDLTYAAGGTGTCSYLGIRFFSGGSSGHVTGSNGVEVKNGNSLYSLVGMAFKGPTTIYDSGTVRDVASWFNRRTKTCRNNYTQDRSTNMTSSYGEPSTEIRCEFVTWGQDDAAWSANGTVYEGAVGSNVYASVGFDGTTNEPEQVGFRLSSATTLKSGMSMSGSKGLLAEGMHWITLLGKVDVSTNSITFGATSPLPPTSIEVRLQQ
jgi:hypothetical protein